MLRTMADDRVPIHQFTRKNALSVLGTQKGKYVSSVMCLMSHVDYEVRLLSLPP